MSDQRQVLVFIGEDSFLANSAAQEAIGVLLPEAERTMGLEVVDGSADNAAQAVVALDKCLDSLCTPPFFGSRKVMWLRDVSFLSDTAAGRSADVKARIQKVSAVLAAGLLPSVYCVISAPRFDKRSSFFKTCAKLGQVKEFQAAEKAYLQERQAVDYAAGVFKEFGIQAGHDVLLTFLNRTGYDSRQIRNEAEKLAVYVGTPRPLKRADVEAVVCESRDALPWDFPDAVGRRNLGHSLVVLRRLLFQKESPFRLLAALEGRIRELIVYREGLDRGWLRKARGGGRQPSYEWGRIPADADAVLTQGLARDPRKANPYRVGILAEQAANYSRAELEGFIPLLVEVYRKLVSSSLPDGLMLEMLLMRMLAPDGGAASGDGGAGKAGAQADAGRAMRGSR